MWKLLKKIRVTLNKLFNQTPGGAGYQGVRTGECMRYILAFIFFISSEAYACKDASVLADASWNEQTKVWLIEEAARLKSSKHKNPQKAYEAYKKVYSETWDKVDGKTFYREGFETRLSCDEISTISKFLNSSEFSSYQKALSEINSEFHRYYMEIISAAADGNADKLNALMAEEVKNMISVVVPSRDLKEGTKLTAENFSYRRIFRISAPNDAVTPNEWKVYEGKKLSKDLNSGETLVKSMIE